MKTMYANQIFKECANEYPCRWCQKASQCTNECISYKSYHYYYKRLGKHLATILMIKLPNCKTKSEALSLINKIDQKTI